jgi:Spy/CpxP family protein refolding chaperone
MNKMSKWKICAYLTAIFLAGVVAGGFVGFKAGRHMMFRHPNPDNMAQQVSDDLQKRLALTPDQVQQVRTIINDGMSHFHAVIGAEVSASFSNANARISAILTPGQQIKYAEIVKENEQFMRGPTNEHSGRRGP